MCVYRFICVQEPVFVGLALFLAKIAVPCRLGQIIPGVKLVGGLIWAFTPALFISQRVGLCDYIVDHFLKLDAVFILCPIQQ